MTEQQAPVFHFYLNRHVELDGDFHAPLSLRLLNGLCENDPTKIEEAITAAQAACGSAAAIVGWRSGEYSGEGLRNM